MHGSVGVLLPVYALDGVRAGEAVCEVEENSGASARTGGIRAARAIPKQP